MDSFAASVTQWVAGARSQFALFSREFYGRAATVKVFFMMPNEETRADLQTFEFIACENYRIEGLITRFRARCLVRNQRSRALQAIDRLWVRWILLAFEPKLQQKSVIKFSIFFMLIFIVFISWFFCFVTAFKRRHLCTFFCALRNLSKSLSVSFNLTQRQLLLSLRKAFNTVFVCKLSWRYASFYYILTSRRKSTSATRSRIFWISLSSSNCNAIFSLF